MVCVVLGIPLNCAALMFLLYNLPKSGQSGIIWAMAIVFNYTPLSQSLIEFEIYNNLSKEESEEERHIICEIYSAVVGCPYALLLGTLNRYTALAHSQFYKNHIPKTRICWGLLFIFSIIIGINISTHDFKLNMIIRKNCSN